MALTPNLNRTAISELNSVFTDQTVYGGAEPLRSAVALFLTAFKVDENQIETPLTVNSFDPELVTQFTVSNGVDGYHIYYFIIVNNYSALVQYEQYDLVWDTTSNKFYEYINTTPSTGSAVTDPLYFTEVLDPTVKLKSQNIPGNVVYQIVRKIVTYQTSICNLKAGIQLAKEGCNDGCGCGSKTGKYAMKIRNYYSVLLLNEATGQFIEGEKNARLAEKYCVDCGCLTR